MISIQTQHFNINRILLLAIGLWPYQQSRLVQFQVIFIFGILTSSIVFQLTAFLTTECTPEFVINVLSITCISIIYLIKYNAFRINIHNTKYLLEELQQICNELKDENEIAIIKNYGCSARRYTIILILLAMCYVVAVNVQPIWPRIFGFLLFLNDSRSRSAIQVTTEYFVDQEKYFYLIMLHMNASFCIGTLATVASAAMFLTYFKHACGIFKIASYRMEQAINNDILQNVKDKVMICEKIIYAVDIHRKSLRFTKFVVTSFEGMFFCILAVGVACLSLNLFRTFQLVSFGNDIEELLLHLSLVISILLYLYLMSYVAQEVTDHNKHVFETVYNVQWYIAPVDIQRMILFLLQIGIKDLKLKLGGLIVASLESASTITSTSLSYFTVLYSTWQ
ncbi:uncharacterized protein LOC116851995 [Odontomachus brunneus]|uniref:uncharacterized protein LOC116851995 n=1 Tax=Odontomachus brunneus TaxID=486640 RepID=UPI0013F21528|nr:uncharacterized protein LOC116851995 [Odontomachus brunneus]